MKRFVNSIFLLCGIALSLAAFPVFGQETSNEVEIDTKPLKDFAELVKAKYLWSKPFSVEAETVLTKEGKFDREKTKFTKTEGDADITETVKQAFEAAGESGWFGYLRMEGIKEVKLSASQNAETFSFSLFSEQATMERANTIASIFNSLAHMVLLYDKNGFKKLDEDEKKLLKGSRVTSQEKTVNMNISLAANDFQEMARRKLNEAKETKAK